MESNYDPMFPDHPVPDQYLSTWANFCTFGDKPAFRWVDDQCNQTDCITYRELNAAASRIATHLRATASLSKGDRVLVIYPPGLDFIKVTSLSAQSLLLKTVCLCLSGSIGLTI